MKGDLADGIMIKKGVLLTPQNKNALLNKIKVIWRKENDHVIRLKGRVRKRDFPNTPKIVGF